MGRRKEQRTAAKIAVKLWGTDSSGRPFIVSVLTRNLSSQGVLLEGVTRRVKIGDAVGLTHEDKKAHFRVSWVGAPGTTEQGLVGLETIKASSDFWDVPLQPPGPDGFVEDGGSRRQFPRFECNAGIEIHAEGDGVPVRGKVVDISLGGCYVEMMIPLSVGTRVQLTLWLDEHKVSSPATVTSSHPGFGVGIKFVGMPKDDRMRLQAYLTRHVETIAFR